MCSFLKCVFQYKAEEHRWLQLSHTGEGCPAKASSAAAALPAVTQQCQSPVPLLPRLLLAQCLWLLLPTHSGTLSRALPGLVVPTHFAAQ